MNDVLIKRGGMALVANFDGSAGVDKVDPGGWGGWVGVDRYDSIDVCLAPTRVDKSSRLS